MIRQGSKAAIVAALLFSVVASAIGQDLEAWFDRAPEAVAYASLRAASMTLAAGIRAAGLEDRLLLDRFVEGARKRVPPDRLIAAIREEAMRLENVSRLLVERSLLPAASADASDLVAEASLLLRAGATAGELAAALDAAAKRGPRVPRAFSAIAVAYAIHARFPLDEADRLRLSAALAGSALDRRRFDSLISVFAKYRAAGLSSNIIASIVVGACDAGGSLERIERELQRRTRTP